MLESIREKAQGPWAKVILVLITVPFALVGIESYFQGNAQQKAVASFGKQAISQAEFDNAVRQQQDRFRDMLGKNYDQSMFDTAEMRQNVLDGLVDQRLVGVAARNAGVATAEASLFGLAEKAGLVEADGKLGQKYEEAARRFGGKLGLEKALRDDNEVRAYAESITNTAFTSRSVIDAMVRQSEASRDVSMISFSPDSHKEKVTLDEAKVQAFYDSKKTEFQIPEQIKVEYIELSQDALTASTQVDMAELKKRYEDNLSAYTTKEERKASHILVGATKDAKPEVKKAAKEKADKLFAEIKADPSKLAALAKTESSDPGSAQNGGDLGFFGKGMMVPPFEAAAFTAQKGDVVGPVETDFGYHIIQLTDIKPSKVKSLDEARPELEAELKKASAQKKFAELQPILSDAIFNDPTSLKLAVERTKLPVVTTDFFSRNSPTNPKLANPKLITELFSDEVKKNKKNSSAIDVGNNTYIAARVVEVKESVQRPLTEVRLQIEQRMMREQTSRLAKEEGEAKLAEAKAKKGTLNWPAALTVTRAKAGGLPPDVVDKALKADVSTLPAFVGHASPQGTYFLIQISKVNEVVVDDAKRKEYVDRMKQTQQGMDVAQVLASLKNEQPVNVNKAMLEKKQ